MTHPVIGAPMVPWNARLMPLRARFDLQHRRDEKSGCWLWMASTIKGYGQIGHNYKKLYAHRVSYLLNVGAIPEGLCVLHRCDNPRCVNPNHLFLGTRKENLEDMTKKGRRRAYRSEDMPTTKLDWGKVEAVRADVRTERAIAKDYGVSPSTIHAIKSGRTWTR